MSGAVAPAPAGASLPYAPCRVGRAPRRLYGGLRAEAVRLVPEAQRAARHVGVAQRLAAGGAELVGAAVGLALRLADVILAGALVDAAPGGGAESQQVGHLGLAPEGGVPRQDELQQPLVCHEANANGLWDSQSDIDADERWGCCLQTERKYEVVGKGFATSCLRCSFRSSSASHGP